MVMRSTANVEVAVMPGATQTPALFYVAAIKHGHTAPFEVNFHFNTVVIL